MLKTLWRSVRDGVVTTGYPRQPAEPPAAFRGAPELVPGASFAALPAAPVCPSGAISGDAAAGRYTIDLARCLFCGRCDAGPGGPVQIGRRYELAERTREPLRVEATRDAGGGVVTLEAPDPDRVAAEVAARIRRTLGRSLHLRHLDAGSCNACDWELVALLNPYYDCRRLGIDFVASPRHADGVIVTGPVTRNLELAARRTYDAMPEPRLVIAVGACGASGGIVGPGYACHGGVADVLPVDVFIPGCPPRPEAILFGILVAMGRLEPRRAAAR